MVSQKDVESFVQEAMCMQDFEHPNVLRLLGVCIDSDADLPIVVLPYMQHGDLLTYLRDDKNVCCFRCKEYV